MPNRKGFMALIAGALPFLGLSTVAEAKDEPEGPRDHSPFNSIEAYDFYIDNRENIFYFSCNKLWWGDSRDSFSLVDPTLGDGKYKSRGDYHSSHVVFHKKGETGVVSRQERTQYYWI